MPGVSRKSVDVLFRDAESCLALGIPAIALFPVVPEEFKTDDAAAAWHPEGLVPRTVRALKERFPGLGVITDIALDPYTSHGQDGLIDATGYVLNDETVVALAKQALCHAEAGVDMVAPSDMMDGRIGALRAALDGVAATSHAHPRLLREVRVGVLRPVPRRGRLGGEPWGRQQVHVPDGPGQQRRGAVGGLPRHPRRRGHGDGQAGHALSRHRAAREGRRSAMPTAVYQVSGEYAMLKAAAQAGWLDERACVLEALTGMKRAGRRRHPDLLRARRGALAQAAGVSMSERRQLVAS